MRSIGHGFARTTEGTIAPLYTAEQRLRRDETPWTLVQGLLAPVQFVIFLVSLALVLRYLVTGDGATAATISIVAKTIALYTIMITGSIWEKVVFGKWLFADAFFWEDVFSMLVLALHTAYLTALIGGYGTERERMLLALAAYATYVINATRGRFAKGAMTLGARQEPLRRIDVHRLDHRIFEPLRPAGRRRDAGLRVGTGASRAGAARSVLRTDRNHLAASQDPGRILSRCRIAHLRPSAAVGRWRNGVRRAALRHRDHRGT